MMILDDRLKYWKMGMVMPFWLIYQKRLTILPIEVIPHNFMAGKVFAITMKELFFNKNMVLFFDIILI